MAYDDTRGRVLVHGGDLGGSFDTNLWEWDGAQWYEFAETGMGPGFRRLHAITYDSARQKMVLIGDGGAREVWELDLSPDVRPAAVVEFAWNAAGVDSVADAITSVQSIRVLAVATGESFPLDPSSTATVADVGFVLEAWDGAVLRWRPFEQLVSTPCDVAVGVPGEPYAVDCLVDDPVTARQLIFGNDNRIYIRMVPKTSTGNGPRPASITVDYIELSVDYQLQ